MRIKLLLASAAAIAAGASPLYARPTVAVGTCNSSVVSFTTIQAAIDQVPANATIQVCPGTYPEQITIGKSLTLTGVTSGNSSLAAIVAPAGGILVNGTEPGGSDPIAAQVLVTNAANVTIANLTVDGSNNNVTSCGTDLVGILFQNASGIIRNNNVINQTQPAGYAGCQGGLAIYVETGAGGTANVSITANRVQGYQKNGITADNAGVSASIVGNSIIGAGATDGAAENGIQIAYGATGTVTGNRVAADIWGPDVFGDTGDAASGILVYDSPGIKIARNEVDSTQYGIVVVGDGAGAGDGATINANRIDATYLYDAIDVCGAGNATINTNTITGASEAAIHLDSSCGSASTGNAVMNNKVNGTCAALLEGPGSTGSGSLTSALNAANIVLSGSDQCPVAPPGRHGHMAKRHASAFRPR